MGVPKQFESSKADDIMVGSGEPWQCDPSRVYGVGLSKPYMFELLLSEGPSEGPLWCCGLS